VAADSRREPEGEQGEAKPGTQVGPDHSYLPVPIEFQDHRGSERERPNDGIAGDYPDRAVADFLAPSGLK